MPTLRQSVLIRAPPAAVREALLDSRSQSLVLGHVCQASLEVGGTFALWDGLITGRNVRLAEDEIVQTWRYAMPGWPAAVESTVLIRLLPEGGGAWARVHLGQTHIPPGCGEAVEEHWREHVWPGLKALLESPPASDVTRTGRRRFLGMPVRLAT